MHSTQLENIIKYRIVVGYLGEKEQFAWWTSSFFSSGSQVFLAPIFSKTQFLAQCHGVTRAALAVHDERIGTGHVYHLFRLPEDMEQDIHKRLHEPGLAQEIVSLLDSKEAALAFLQQEAGTTIRPDVGPVRIGTIAALRDPKIWRTVAARYALAFAQKSELFPYFSDVS